MHRFKKFCGGPLDTNCFFREIGGKNVLFDAPQGADDAFAGERIDLLLLTHGHFDHIADAAKILRRHGCAAGYHADTTPMATEPDFFQRWGFALEVESFRAEHILAEGSTPLLPGWQIFEVPGHCPGSLCFFDPETRTLVGGDVLFRGGVGRWDLPGGNRELLLTGIRKKLLPLGDDVTVLPGHGPATTLGQERRENAFLQDEN